MQDQITKLKKTLESREKQLVDMAQMLADYNQNLNNVWILFHIISK